MMDADSETYRAILEQVSDGVYFLDRERRILSWNKAAEMISGYGQDEIVQTCCKDGFLRHVDDEGNKLCESETCPVACSIATGAMLEAHVYLHHKEGHRVPILVKTSPVRDANGEIIGAYEVFHPLLSHQEYERRVFELSSLALSDSLTGIGNRRLAEIRMKSRFDEMQLYGHPFGLAMLDIDHFKAFNDTWGHAVGDVVLKMVAKTLSGNIRSSDVAARWGGEEFVLLFVLIDKMHLSVACEKLRALVEASQLIYDGEPLHVTVSFGASLCRKDDTVETLIARADALMYQSKMAGRNRVMAD